MATLQSFYKIKSIREREKTEHQKQYQLALESFEEVATKLYETLKEKELADRAFELEQARKTVKASSFLQHQRYIEGLDRKIDFLQPKVQEARVLMNEKQMTLTDAHVEVKKFEKLIEHKVEKQKKWLKEEESKQMDDLSMKQYLNFQNR